MTLFPAAEMQAQRQANPGVEIGPQRGTPNGMKREMIVSALGVPCNPQPWGTLAAIDLQEGAILWHVPIGTIRDIAPVPLPVKYGVPNLGGPMITARGLIFLAATVDDYLRAFDLDTGKELWRARPPAGGQATPITSDCVRRADSTSSSPPVATLAPTPGSVTPWSPTRYPNETDAAPHVRDELAS